MVNLNIKKGLIMYTVPKSVLFQNQIFIGENFVYEGVFIVKKTAIMNIKNLKTVETAIKWMKDPAVYIVPLSDEKENELDCLVHDDIGNEPLYKFSRSKVMLDRGENSPLAVFVCPEMGLIKFMDDEYCFNFGITTMYSTESGKALIDSEDKNNWNLAIFTNTKLSNFDTEFEIVANCLFSENFAE